MVDPRWRTVLTVTPYLVVVMLVAFSVGMLWGDWSRLVPVLILCLAYLGWVVLFRAQRPEVQERQSVVAVFLVVLILLNLALVLLESYFGFLALATFPFAYTLAAWPGELYAVGGTAVVAGLAQASSFGTDPAGQFGRLAVVVLNVVAMCGLSWGLALAQRGQEQAATLAERGRLAREIHDTLAQGFAGIVAQLQAADATGDEAERRRRTAAALDLARDGLAEARRSVQALRPVALDGMGLPEAVTVAAKRWSERTRIPVDVQTDGMRAFAGRALGTDAEVALLRTAQEALANVEQHAGARHVTLTLRRGGTGVHLEVRDDGRGFRPGQDRPASGDGGYGLVAMRERIEALAGALVVESSPGGGTAIRAEVPA